MEPTRGVMCKLALAASLMRNERVYVVQMFELTESELTHQFLVVAKLVLNTLPDEPKVRS